VSPGCTFDGALAVMVAVIPVLDGGDPGFEVVAVSESVAVSVAGDPNGLSVLAIPLLPAVLLVLVMA